MNPLLLHCGCGPIKLPGFVNIDQSAHWQPDLCCDVLRLSDHFEEGIANVLFSCHMLEHLEPERDAVRFLVQALRVLKRGGVIRLVVPDLRLVAAKYLAGDSLRDIYADGSKRYVGGIDCGASRFTYFMRAFDHQQVYDEPLLGAMLRDAGFANVRKVPFGVSDTPALRGIDRFQAESLSMEGTKA